MRFIPFGLLALCQFVIRAKSDWWESAAIYQIYPASFYDTDGDGFGDLNGITAKLDYVKYLDMAAVWIGPIYDGPFIAYGYDVTNYKDIYPRFGTLADFDRLVQAAKRLGLKIIMDMVPNHTSDQHEWFISSMHREAGYEDYYVWHPGKLNNVTGERDLPNNWIGMSYQSAWKWNDIRQEYFLAQFSPNMPDLNFLSDGVKNEFNSIFKFWMDRGVDGFRLDAVSHTIENPSLPDEPVSGLTNDPYDFTYLNHIHTMDQPETYELIYEWRRYFENYNHYHPLNGTHIFFTESYSSLDKIMPYYGNGSENGAHFPMNFQLFTVTRNSSVGEYKAAIDLYLNLLKKNRNTPNWILGNHDQSRVASRLGQEKIDIHSVLQMTLPGVTITYNGEEIGMTDVCMIYVNGTPELCNGAADGTFGYDWVRSPLQWDNTTSAGFSKNNRTWLPISPSYIDVNIRDQQFDGLSHWRIFRSLTALRKYSDVLKFGETDVKVINPNVLGYVRYLENAKKMFVLLNFSSATFALDLRYISELSYTLKVRITGRSSIYKIRDTVYLNEIMLRSFDSLVLEEV